MIDNVYCEKIKRGETDAVNFAAFLEHVGSCKDCIRRIYSQLIVKTKQSKIGDK